MLEKIKSQTRITEVDAIGTQLLGACANASLECDPNLSSMMAQIEGLLSKFGVSIKRIKSESELEEKDETRDIAVKRLYHLVGGYQYHPDVIIQEAALKVLDVLGHYGIEITRQGYASESSLINSLLADLGKAEIQEALVQLSGADECVTTIRTAQHEFETYHLAYEADKAEESTYENATSIKRQLVKLINGQLVVYLQAMYVVNEAMYGELVRVVAQIIADSNEVVRKRSKKSSKEVGA